LLKLVLLTILG